MAEWKDCQVEFEIIQSDILLIKLKGQLTAASLDSVWQSCLQRQAAEKPKRLEIHAEQVSYCDSAGVGLLLALETRQEQQHHQFLVHGLEPQFLRLFHFFRERCHPQAFAEKKPVKFNFFSAVGKTLWQSYQQFHLNLIYIGELFFHLIRFLRHPKRLRWGDTLTFITNVGPDAMPIIFLIGFLLGLILAFQSAIQLRQFGASIYVANLVGVSLMRELGPLMTAIVLVSRSISAFAAELGTMKINQEVDALRVMGIEPITFLALPRIVAVVVMIPFLNVFMILFGLMGCGVVMKSMGFSMSLFISQLRSAIWLQDFMGGMIKTVVFGFVIASIGCLHGLRAGHGPKAVGAAATGAVVSAIVMLVLIDGLFSQLYYVLDI